MILRAKYKQTPSPVVFLSLTRGWGENMLEFVKTKDLKLFSTISTFWSLQSSTFLKIYLGKIWNPPDIGEQRSGMSWYDLTLFYFLVSPSLPTSLTNSDDQTFSDTEVNNYTSVADEQVPPSSFSWIVKVQRRTGHLVIKSVNIKIKTVVEFIF